MDLMPRGDSVIKYGYFEVKPEITSEAWQVNIEDFVVEVQTDLESAPKKLLCVCIDDKDTIIARGASIFIGGLTGNSYTSTNRSDIRSESASFTSPDATYLKFDEEMKKIYVHVMRWEYVKCGKWMWIAIYDE